MGRVILSSQIEEIKKQQPKARWVFTNGCFDLLHVGHIRYLTEAKNLGDQLFVGINTDDSVRRLKGDSRPVQSQSDRAEILSHIDVVDWVCLFGEDTPEKLIHILRPDVLVKGGDWIPENIVGYQFVKSYGGEVKSLCFVAERSTTKILS